MNLLTGIKACAEFSKHSVAVIRLLGLDEYIKYRGKFRELVLRMVTIDDHSIVVFHEEGTELHVDLVIGVAGTIDRIAQLKEFVRSMDIKTIHVRTRSRAMRRIHKRLGFKDHQHNAGEYQLILEI